MSDGRAEIRSFRDLDVWQVSMHIAIAIYEVAKRLPESERFELSAQMRRAAVSVPSNVAEGHAHRINPRTYAHHVRIALGSLAELETDLELAVRLQFVDAKKLTGLFQELARTAQLLHGVLRSQRRKIRLVRRPSPTAPECERD
jgi:four helix bundle protein